ncbi:hypothetical protein C8Q79DRAFT_50430 [Trametes meyenii]|nr:hypothetical protein C8Q79DRAFT_50430 [Trametes meyenii]
MRSPVVAFGLFAVAVGPILAAPASPNPNGAVSHPRNTEVRLPEHSPLLGRADAGLIGGGLFSEAEDLLGASSGMQNAGSGNDESRHSGDGESAAQRAKEVEESAAQRAKEAEERNEKNRPTHSHDDSTNPTSFPTHTPHATPTPTGNPRSPKNSNTSSSADGSSSSSSDDSSNTQSSNTA